MLDQEIQEVFDFMKSQGYEFAAPITWGELKEKYPVSIRFCKLFLEKVDGEFEDTNVTPDTESFELPKILINLMNEIEEVQSPFIIAESFKSVVSVIISILSDMVADKHEYDEETTEKIKVQAQYRFREYLQSIHDTVAELFTVA